MSDVNIKVDDEITVELERVTVIDPSTSQDDELDNLLELTNYWLTYGD